MKWLPRLLITVMLSTGVAAVLSYLPQLEEHVTSPVFRTAKAQPVSDANVVDVMSKIQLNLRIRKVEITHAIISVDLFVSPATEQEEIIQDLYEIPKSLFTHSTNINQVLVRVIDSSKTNGTGTTLMLAIDARREKWLPNETNIPIQSAEMEQYLQSHFRMTYTPKWQERFDIKS